MNGGPQVVSSVSGVGFPTLNMDIPKTSLNQYEVRCSVPKVLKLCSGELQQDVARSTRLWSILIPAHARR